jgi:hypothetical protein
MRGSIQIRRGQATVEFALIYGLVLLPLTFMIVFGCEMLWVWHSVADWTRFGARYAATHCFQQDGENVKNWMRNNVPLMIDQDKFALGDVAINVEYFSEDSGSGLPEPFTCSSAECSPACVPQTVRITVSNYTYRRMLDVFGLPGVPLPDFRTVSSMQGAGCNPDEQICLP